MKDYDITTKALEFATAAHGDQKYGDMPYNKHLTDVYNVLREFGIEDQTILCSAYLHDTIEDTSTNYNDIKNMFGLEIAEIVYCVTDELGRNRKERHEKTYPKIASNKKATTLKLADRIANSRASVIVDNKFDMYKKEYAGFRAALNDGVSNKAMWDVLDSLMGHHV